MNSSVYTDELHEPLERKADQEVASRSPQLRPDFDGITLLQRRLEDANTENPHAQEHIALLMEALQVILLRLQARNADQVALVSAVGEWASSGVDLRNSSWEELLLEIVLEGAERPFALYRQISEEVFADLADGELFLQFTLRTKPEWQQAEEAAQNSDSAAGAITLFVRA